MRRDIPKLVALTHGMIKRIWRADKRTALGSARTWANRPSCPVCRARTNPQSGLGTIPQLNVFALSLASYGTYQREVKQWTSSKEELTLQCIQGTFDSAQRQSEVIWCICDF